MVFIEKFLKKITETMVTIPKNYFTFALANAKQK